MKAMTNRLALSLVPMAALVVVTACANDSGAGRPAAIGAHDTKLGPVMTDSAGRTLYTFDKDPRGKSVCNGKCAENWPPLTVSAGVRPVGAFTIVVRDDGTRQWAFDGKPLYGWVKDREPGDVTGHRFKNVWSAAMAPSVAEDPPEPVGGGDGGDGGSGGGY